MFRKKLQRIFSIILAAGISVSLLSACEKTESVPEETTVSETTVATTPTDLTEEEMAIWESMPDIVTMRVYNDYETETTEILYITKYGEMKSFISDEYYEGYKDSEWIENKINDSKVEAISLTDVHKLIEFYNVFSLNDNENKIINRKNLSSAVIEEIKYSYEIYGAYDINELSIVSIGTSRNQYILYSLYGEEIFQKYLKLDCFLEDRDLY